MSKNITAPSRLGDLAEFYAVTWLWDQGYEVFLNPGSSGVIDMVAWKDGEIKLIDVKTQGLDKRSPSGRMYAPGRSKEQVKLGVVILAFNPETRKCKFVEHKE